MDGTKKDSKDISIRFNSIRERKKKLQNFGTFLCRTRPNNKRCKIPNFRFCGECEYMTVNFLFSVSTGTPVTPVPLLDSSATLSTVQPG